MRAILVATGESPEMTAFRDQWPTALLPLLDRPWIQHVVEQLAAQGFTELDIVLSHLPGQVRALLGDGRRWGVTIRCHLASDAARPFRAIRALGLPNGDEPVLLAWADRIPTTRPADDRPVDGRPLLYCREGVWTGWAWVPCPELGQIPPDADEAEVAAQLLDAPGARTVEVAGMLDATSCDGLLAAQRAAMAGFVPGLMLDAREVEPGVWLSRNVSIHPTARIAPPVYLGEDCQIGEGVQFGPGAVLGRGCVVDSRCTIAEAIIFPSSYVGRGLELVDAIVDRNRLVHARLGAAVAIDDDFLLGNLSDGRFHRLATDIVSRLSASVLLAMAAPILLATACVVKLTRRGPALIAREVVRLPATTEPSRWRTFRLLSFDAAPRSGPADILLRVLPGLINVVRGDLRVVGLPPRSSDEIRNMADDSRVLYLHSKAGLITEALATLAGSPTADEIDTVSACHVASAGTRHDAGLVLKYLRRVLSGGALPRDAVQRPHDGVAPARGSFSAAKRRGIPVPLES